MGINAFFARQFVRHATLDGAWLRYPFFVTGTLVASHLPLQILLTRGVSMMMDQMNPAREDASTYGLFKRLSMLTGEAMNLEADNIAAMEMAEMLVNGQAALGSRLSALSERLMTAPGVVNMTGLAYPDDMAAIDKKVMPKGVFCSFINLLTHSYALAGDLAARLEACDGDMARQGHYREQMAELNARSTAIILCFLVCMMGYPEKGMREFIEEGGVLDYAALQRFYPEQTAIGESWQYGYMVQEAVNRIVRDVSTGRVEADYSIAMLEKAGHYTPDLKQQIMALSEQYRDQKMLGLDDLPEPVREAIMATRDKAIEAVNHIDPLRRRVYHAMAEMPLAGGVVSNCMSLYEAYMQQTAQQSAMAA